MGRSASASTGGTNDLLAPRHHHRLLLVDGLRILEPRPASPRNLLSVLCLRQRGLHGDCLGVALIPSNPMGLQSRRNPRVKGGDKLPPPLHYLFTTNAFSIRIVCNVHTNDCFFDTSEKRVDGIDVLGHERQQTSDQTPQAELPRRETRRVPLDVADCSVRAIDKAAVGRSVHRCPPFIFVITKAIAVPIRRATQSAVDPSCRRASARPIQGQAARQSRQRECSAWIPRPRSCR